MYLVCYFCKGQTGYANKDVLLQDNKSGILLENNGIYLAGT